MKNTVNIGIIGGSGYTGLELIKILGNHKHSNLKFITSRKLNGQELGSAFPSFLQSKYCNLLFKAAPDKADFNSIDILFLCLPPKSSMEFVKDYYGKGEFKIIDIGSDFRLKDVNDYKFWYGTEHVVPELLDEFTYGLPEINREEIKKSRNISNPGCYPTSVLLGLAPLLKSSYRIESINVDSKSGVTGAGRKLKEAYLYGNLNNNFYAYSASGHRHTGEMEQEIKKICGYELKVDFTPHLLPLNRGIFSSIYCKLKGAKDIKDNIINIYKRFYKDSKFVKFLGENIPEIKNTTGTNLCMIGIDYDVRTGTLKIFSSIDNLLKGAAGQAVQNMNIMMGFDEDEGLKSTCIYS
jgi:N-acetyl-gamma-glutamyl-phosphate reductase